MLVVALAIMHDQAAPGWAMTLCVVMCTRLSTLTSSIDMHNVQGVTRVLVEQLEEQELKKKPAGMQIRHDKSPKPPPF